MLCPSTPKDHHEDQDTDYEAATIAHLHAQATAVQNIKALVRITLDLLPP
jgi:hypothetical protein